MLRPDPSLSGTSSATTAAATWLWTCRRSRASTRGVCTCSRRHTLARAQWTAADPLRYPAHRASGTGNQRPRRVSEHHRIKLTHYPDNATGQTVPTGSQDRAPPTVDHVNLISAARSSLTHNRDLGAPVGVSAASARRYQRHDVAAHLTRAYHHR